MFTLSSLARTAGSIIGSLVGFILAWWLFVAVIGFALGFFVAPVLAGDFMIPVIISLMLVLLTVATSMPGESIVDFYEVRESFGSWLAMATFGLSRRAFVRRAVVVSAATTVAAVTLVPVAVTILFSLVAIAGIYPFAAFTFLCLAAIGATIVWMRS